MVLHASLVTRQNYVITPVIRTTITEPQKMAEVIRADISRPYLLRLGLVSLFSLGLAFWCVYDGLVTYPAQRIRANSYIEILEETLANFRTEADEASRSLSATLPPTQWGADRWTREVEDVLSERRNASTAEQNLYFLQLAWLYLNVPSMETNKLTEADRLRIRSTIRKTLVKFFDEPDEYSISTDDAIASATSEFAMRWDAQCKTNNWLTDYPGEPKNPYAIDQQFYMAAGIIPFSLFFLFTLLRNRKAWVEASGTGLRNSRGSELSFEQIESFDKKRWDKKGIARVHYTSGDSKRTFLLDDCNYDYQPVRAIVRLVESHIDREKITGGDPEPPVTNEQANKS